MVFLKSVRFSRKQEEKRSSSVMQERTGVIFFPVFCITLKKYIQLVGYIFSCIINKLFACPDLILAWNSWFLQYFLIKRKSFFVDGTDREIVNFTERRYAVQYH